MNVAGDVVAQAVRVLIASGQWPMALALVVAFAVITVFGARLNVRPGTTPSDPKAVGIEAPADGVVVPSDPTRSLADADKEG